MLHRQSDSASEPMLKKERNRRERSVRKRHTNITNLVIGAPVEVSRRVAVGCNRVHKPLAVTTPRYIPHCQRSSSQKKSPV